MTALALVHLGALLAIVVGFVTADKGTLTGWGWLLVFPVYIATGATLAGFQL